MARVSVVTSIGNGSATTTYAYNNNGNLISSILGATTTATDTKAEVKNRVPVIGLTRDESDVAVEILLHVVDGQVNELEFVRLDGKQIQGLPRLDVMKKQVFDAIVGNEVKYKAQE